MLNPFIKIQLLIKFNNNREGSRGMALYLSVMVLSLLFAIALGISLLSTRQIKELNEAGHAVIAFAAAESGIEWALSHITISSYNPSYPLVTLGNGATYTVTAELCGPGNQYLCVKSVGAYKDTRRAVKIQL